MSKRIKNLIEKELGSKFKNIEGCAVLNPLGLDGIKTNKIRRELNKNGMKMTVVRNSLVRRATGESKLKGFEKLLNGASAVVYGEKVEASAIARVLVDLKKDNDKLEFRGVFFDGEVFDGDKGVKLVSSFPTRTEAIGQVIGALLGPAQQIAGALNQGGMVAGLVKAIEDKGANG